LTFVAFPVSPLSPSPQLFVTESSADSKRFFDHLQLGRIKLASPRIAFTAMVYLAWAWGAVERLSATEDLNRLKEHQLLWPETPEIDFR
jgi:hypothetical protein